MANSIVIVNFPIIAESGFLYNMFRAFVEEKIHLRMQNESSCSVTNNGGFVKLSSFTDYSPVPGDIGEEIVIIGGDYQAIKGTITSYEEVLRELITDIPYISNANVRFFIKYANLRMKYRFSAFTFLDDQSAANLFESEFIYYPDKFGELYIDISLIKSLMKPSFEALNDYNNDLAKSFQVQYQTLFDNNLDTWHSAHNTSLPIFEAFLSIHATGRIAPIDYWGKDLESSLDSSLDKKMWRGYDKIFSTLTPKYQTPSDIRIQIHEYNNIKSFISSQDLVAVRNSLDGLLISKLTSLDAETRYIMFRFSTGIGFIITNYDYYLTVYDTKKDENEYYITWISNNGTIRQWLFTNKILFEETAEYDIITQSDYRQVPNDYEEIITLEAKGLSTIERKYLSSLFISNKIKIENDGTEIKAIVDNSSWTYENRTNSHIVTCELKLKPMAVMNV